MRKSRSALLLSLLILVLPALLAAEQEKKTSVQLITYDQLVQPGKKILIKGRLVSQGLLFRDRPMSGERVEFFLDGKSLGISLTGGDGFAAREVGSLPPGEHPVILRLKSTQYDVPEAKARMEVWELEPPILIVNLAAAVEEKEGEGPSLLEPRFEMAPRPDAIRVLKGLAQEYHLLFFTDKEETRLSEIKTWLASQNFPSAPLLAWKIGSGPVTHELVLGEELEALRSAGWKNLKIGIGATALDAEPFLKIGLKAIILVDETENAMEMPAGTIKMMTWKKVEQVIKKISGP
jgi:hypothetical protein